MADFDPEPKYEYSQDGKTVTWTNRYRMPKVAAQAGDEQANFDDQIAKITPTQLDTWRAEVVRLNDLIAHASGVQAGDEPIYCPFCGDAESQTVEHVEGTIVHPAYFVRCDNCGAVGPTSDRGDHRQLWNARVSPRATADVERDALYFAQQIVRTHINLDSWMRQDHACNECVPGQKSVKEGFQCFYHRAKSFIATTKPGA